MTTFYVSIGNSDDKLSQKEYSDFISDVHEILREHADTIHGRWFSEPSSQWQNSCWCFVVDNNLEAEDDITEALAALARLYRQDSITLAPALVKFIGPMNQGAAVEYWAKRILSKGNISR